MAEVLPPLSSSNDPASVIYVRPSSTEKFSSAMASSSPQSRFNSSPRNQYATQNGAPTGYRGTSSGPIAPYAFKSTPQLRNENKQEPYPRNTSAPMLPPLQPLSSDNTSPANRQRYPAPPSVSSTTSSGSSSNPPSLPPLGKTDSSLFSTFSVPEFSVGSTLQGPPSTPGSEGGQQALPDLAKPSPERYRRGNRSAETGVPAISAIPTQPPQAHLPFPNSNGLPPFDTGKMGQFFYAPQPRSASPSRKPVAAPSSPASKAPESPASYQEDRSKVLASNIEKPEPPKRYRRQGSLGNSVDSGYRTPPESQPGYSSPKEPASPVQVNARQDTRPSSSGSAHRHSSSSSRNDTANRSVASADTVRRMQNPSPLSKPLATGETPSTRPANGNNPATGASVTPSAAVAAMAALNVADKDANKGVKSRLRRAFSFGSSQELKRATVEADAAADRAKARQEQFSNELDEEQDAIAKQQEAAGLGNSIYSGQGNVFTGSTDNLSISSTASSASLMLRKMGKGMKKGGRSIKGLFRPKSVIGVPAADEPSQASVGQVTRITVEAEREKVNVNADPHTQPGGGTGFPKLERNSIETGRISLSNDNARHEPSDAGSKDSRRSIIGGEQDRQEVLAAVKRGILKRTGTWSPVISPASHPTDSPGEHPSPTTLNGGIERRGSPVPSTSSSEPRRNGHRRTDSHTLEGDDYFGAVPRLPGNQSTRSLPGTPRSVSRNISFSPRIQTYDVWSSSEYDRRGDIATCNRLTPMLAQQIKEELNNFKMEMEVHELSKPHTHFF